jgi:hypothetical protein
MDGKYIREATASCERDIAPTSLLLSSDRYHDKSTELRMAHDGFAIATDRTRSQPRFRRSMP